MLVGCEIIGLNGGVSGGTIFRQVGNFYPYSLRFPIIKELVVRFSQNFNSSSEKQLWLFRWLVADLVAQ